MMSQPINRVVQASSLDWHEKAMGILRRGGILIYPTETVYGLGCDPFQGDAVGRIKRLKQRESPEQSFLILVPGRDKAMEMVSNPSDEARLLMEAFWPGPLTLVFQASNRAPAPVVSPEGTLAMRVSPDPVCQRLTGSFGPLVSTSANPREKAPAATARRASAYFPRGVDLIVDDGPRGKNPPSTLVDVTGNHANVLRSGAVGEERIRQVIRAGKGGSHG